MDLNLIIQTEKNSTAGRAVDFFQSIRDYLRFLVKAPAWGRIGAANNLQTGQDFFQLFDTIVCYSCSIDS